MLYGSVEGATTSNQMVHAKSITKAFSKQVVAIYRQRMQIEDIKQKREKADRYLLGMVVPLSELREYFFLYAISHLCYFN